MNPRTLLLTSAAALAMAVPSLALAQQAPGPARTGHRAGFVRIVRSLNLSPEQRTQMRQIVAQYRQAHPKGSKPDPQARKALRAQLLAILTPDQRLQLKSDIHRRKSMQPVPEETAQP